MGNLESRVLRLEKQNHRIKIISIALLATLGAGGLMGQAGQEDRAPQRENVSTDPKPLAPGRRPYLKWSGRVDGADYIVIQGNELSIRHDKNNPISRMRYKVLNAIPKDTNTHMEIKNKTGRGKVLITQQPSKANNYTLEIHVTDPQPGAENYSFQVWGGKRSAKSIDAESAKKLLAGMRKTEVEKLMGPPIRKDLGEDRVRHNPKVARTRNLDIWYYSIGSVSFINGTVRSCSWKGSLTPTKKLAKELRDIARQRAVEAQRKAEAEKARWKGPYWNSVKRSMTKGEVLKLLRAPQRKTDQWYCDNFMFSDKYNEVDREIYRYFHGGRIIHWENWYYPKGAWVKFKNDRLVGMQKPIEWGMGDPR